MKARPSILLAAALLSSCSPPIIDVAVHGSGVGSTVTLSQDWGFLFFSRREAPCVWQVSLFTQGEPRDRPVWRIESVGERNCLDLGLFAIGTPPAGFRETVRLSNPAHGTYTIIVHGVGQGDGTITL